MICDINPDTLAETEAMLRRYNVAVTSIRNPISYQYKIGNKLAVLAATSLLAVAVVLSGVALVHALLALLGLAVLGSCDVLLALLGTAAPRDGGGTG